jgi:hypothetical protein
MGFTWSSSTSPALSSWTRISLAHSVSGPSAPRADLGEYPNDLAYWAQRPFALVSSLMNAGRHYLFNRGGAHHEARLYPPEAAWTKDLTARGGDARWETENIKVSTLRLKWAFGLSYT